MTINWQPWDLQNEFSVFDAACLWLEIEPTNELRASTPPGLEAMMKAIEQQAGGYRGDGIYVIDDNPTDFDRMLDDYVSMGTGINRQSKPRHVNRYPEAVQRASLQKMANACGQKPKFLFSEVREQVKADESELTSGNRPSTTRSTSYLKLIKGLLIKLSINPTDRGIAKKLVGFVSEAGESIGDDKIRDILKEIDELL
jgi:hypothetical protein